MECNFFCLASGSSGNCFYLEKDGFAILIDAGISLRTIKRILKERDIDTSSIKALLVTHDHADHIKGVGNLANEMYVPVYATAECHKGMRKSYCMTREIDSLLVRHLVKDTTEVIGPFEVEPFEVLHDGTDNVGYEVRFGDSVFVIITDCGSITKEIGMRISNANYLVLEANYDKSMLETGPYPQYLKERIASDHGHLSNADCAEAIMNYACSSLRHVWLCHLSEENNHPEIARKEVELTLRDAGIIAGKDFELDVLKRKTPSPMHKLV